MRYIIGTISILAGLGLIGYAWTKPDVPYSISGLYALGTFLTCFGIIRMLRPPLPKDHHSNAIAKK